MLHDIVTYVSRPSINVNTYMYMYISAHVVTQLPGGAVYQYLIVDY